jgi:hypothetical protein
MDGRITDRLGRTNRHAQEWDGSAYVRKVKEKGNIELSLECAAVE